MAIKGKLNDRDAKCPFFAAHTQFRIHCEGLFPGSHSEHVFAKSADKSIQYSVFCCLYYEKCEQYMALMQKYED